MVWVYRGIGFLIGIFLIGLINLTLITSETNTNVKELKREQAVTTTTSRPPTPTTYQGVKCIVKGYEINTSLEQAKALGC